MRSFFRSSLVLAIAAAVSATHADAIDDYIRERMEEDHVPGVCIALVSPNKEPMVRSYGYANLETQTPFTPQTVFRIASVSKQFCGYAALRAIGEGKMSLSDPVTKFFPDQPASWKQITIKDLLGHRSGIAEVGGFSFSTDYSVPAYLKLLGDTELAEKPGETYRYNNHGYSVLGLIVGKIYGSSLPAVVKQNIFDPIGMTNTRYYDRDEVVPNRANAYRWRNGKYINPMPLRPDIFHGSGGILSTMEDMLKYDRALAKQDALSHKLLEQQWTPVFGGRNGYGAGWFVSHPEGEKVITHTGGTWGFTTMFRRNLTTGETFIMFRNAEGGEQGEWMQEITRLAKELNLP